MVYSSIILVTVVGNVMILAAVTTNKVLQRPCNIFLASLACADLCVSLSVQSQKEFNKLNEVMSTWNKICKTELSFSTEVLLRVCWSLYQNDPLLFDLTELMMSGWSDSDGSQGNV